jgi:hypothetical protein
MREFLALLMVLAPLLASATAEPVIERLPFPSSERAAQPSVAVDPREGFVLTWQEREAGVATLRYAVLGSDGAESRRGTIAQGDDWFVNGADFPNLAVLDNGDWVTFFLPKTSPGTYSYAIKLVRSRDAGRSWDEPVLIHRDGTDTEHGFVSLLPTGGDRVRAVWLDGRHMAAHGGDGHAGPELMTLRSAVMGRDGVPREEHELDDLTCACCQTSAVRIGDRSVVAYRDRSRDEVRDIQLVEHVEGRWSAPRVLHADGWVIAACPVNGPALATDGRRLAATWPTMAGGEMQVQVAIGDPTGFGAPRPLAGGADELGRVDVAAWQDRWLATRVGTVDRVPVLWLSVLDGDGRVTSQHRLADRVGGYPRLAVHGDVALVAWAEAAAGQGQSRIGIARVADSRGAIAD